MVDYIFGQDVKDKIYHGMCIAHDAIGCTMGPGGRLVSIPKKSVWPYLTKDGATVAKAIHTHSDPYVAIGIRMVVQACVKQERAHGDGTTLTAILCRKIWDAFIASTMSTREFAAMMDGHIDHLVTELGTYIKQVETGDDLRSIAMVSTNGDAELSECVTNAVLSGGKYGHVACTIRNTPGIELVKHSGYVFGSGIRNREFVNSGASGCLVENVYYLIAEKHIATASQISHIAQSLIDAETSDDDSQPFFLAIIGGDFSDSFKTQIVSSFVDQTKLCRCLFIDYGTIMPEKRKFVLDDLAAVTGATIIPADTTSWKSITHMSLGYSGSMYSDPEKTVIQAINSENAEEYKYYVDAVQNRIAALNEIKEKAGDQYRISLCEESIGMLSGGLQEIRIGAHSETELFERRDRADDAIRACKSALESGFLAGGGTVLLGLAENGSFYAEFADIMRYPATVIARNAEITMEEHIKNVTEKGVIDPAGVVIGAIKNSWSVVKQAIRCECMITED